VKPFETSNKFADIWDIPATVHETIPHIREYRERTSATAFSRNTQAKKEAVAAHLQQRQELEKSLQHYIQNGKIDLIEHPFMDASIRKLLLKWLSLSFQNEERTIATEFGQVFAIKVDKSIKVRLESEDGFLEMPNVVYVLIDKENTGGGRNAGKQ
jgi:tRNA A37 methylthiotransferase MiaB